ncbi:MAG: ATP-dependent DNA ligase [Microbacterium sp.]
MAAFTYEHLRVDFDDRVLMHLQHVIYNKLRRGESMAFTWPDDDGGGRMGVWLHPAATVIFEVAGGTILDLNRGWLDKLAVVANSPTGLHVIPELGADDKLG